MRVLVSMLMVFCLSGVTAYAAEVDSVTSKEIDSQFSGDGLTKLQKDEAWKKYKGKCIEWEAELAYLDEVFFGGLSIGFKHKPSTLTYDVLVSAPGSMKKEILSWRQGKVYRYRATLKSPAGSFLPMVASWGCK